MSDRPVGTVTLLFTDMEGSTRACEQFPTETRAALQRHDQIMAEQVEAHEVQLLLSGAEATASSPFSLDQAAL
jgi:class 3 adenylate cyclase